MNSHDQDRCQEIPQVTGRVTVALDARPDERQTDQARSHGHRIRKLLLSVRAIARHTIRDSTDLAAFETIFDGRIDALSRVHDELARNDWRSTDLRTLILNSLTGLDRDEQRRVHLQGPDVQLDPDAAISLSLPLHELVSHAHRHGALAVSSGSVRVEWDSNAGELSLSWIESGLNGPPPPDHARFATLLLTGSLEYELDAEVKLARAPDGLQFFVRAPRAVI